MTPFKHPDEEPLWKEEFPIHAADERYVSRRQFSRFLALTSLGMFVGNLWILVRSWFDTPPTYPRQVVASATELPVGGVKIFQYPDPDNPCIMVRTDSDTYVAYSQKCPHLACTVYYSKEQHRLECPCHEGYFSVGDGSVLQGPPARSLPRVVLERQGDDIVAVKMTL